MNIVGLCGSLRRGSVNRMALDLAGAAMPPSMVMQVVPWRDLPPFDADVLAAGVPPAVSVLRERIREADGVLIATPEYNFSIPGMFKNALDWLSRGDDQPFAHKPVAILSASPGPLGGSRVQYELRKVLLFMNAMVLAKPEVFIGNAAARFDAEGHCLDDTTRAFVSAQMTSLEAWVQSVRRMR
ncbi:MAG: NAD(P)H-dependent oxidoreductase [Comamonadaceae bacterium]|nr:MAG: NAD(P)H-dependent oxidoreductase [Comamonadaceae bacterium]